MAPISKLSIHWLVNLLSILFSSCNSMRNSLMSGKQGGLALSLSPLTMTPGNVTSLILWPHQPSRGGGTWLKVKWAHHCAQSMAVQDLPRGTSWLSENCHFEQHAIKDASILPGPAPRPPASSFFNKASMQFDSWIYAQRNVHLICVKFP